MNSRCSQCENCNLRHRPSTDGAGGAGVNTGKVDVILVGESPGAIETSINRPISGQVSSLLIKALELVKVKSTDYYFTNAVSCRPLERAPSAIDIKACRSRLVEEITQRRPKVVVLLGSTALKSLGNYAGADNIMTTRGRYRWSSELNAWILPIYHPSFVLRQPNLFHDFMRDLQKINMLRKKIREESLPPIKYWVIGDIEKAIKTCEFLMKQKEIAVDIETTGFDPWKDRILCAAASWEDGKAVVFAEELFQNTDVKFYTVLKQLLELQNVVWDWQNGKFDCGFFRALGINARVDEDTMLLHYCIDERPGTHDLGNLATEYLGVDEYKDMAKQYVRSNKKNTKGEKPSYADVPRPILYQYCAMDVDYTRRLRPILTKLVKMEGDRTYNFLYKQILIPGSEALLQMEMNGFNLDHEYRDQLDKQYQQILHTQLIELQAEAYKLGWTAEGYATAYKAKKVPGWFNPNSAKQVGYLLYDLLKIPLYKKKKRTTSKTYLVKIKDKYAYIKKHMEFKKAGKLYSTYIKGMLKNLCGDNKVHATFKLHSTVTGRSSSSAPNLQNQPRGALIKSMYKASPGHVIIDCDYSQIELKTLAILSGDPFLLNTFIAGKDLHDEVALEFYGPNFTSEDRVKSKAVNFGTFKNPCDAEIKPFSKRGRLRIA